MKKLTVVADAVTNFEQQIENLMRSIDNKSDTPEQNAIKRKRMIDLREKLRKAKLAKKKAASYAHIKYIPESGGLMNPKNTITNVATRALRRLKVAAALERAVVVADSTKEVMQRMERLRKSMKPTDSPEVKKNKNERMTKLQKKFQEMRTRQRKKAAR